MQTVEIRLWDDLAAQAGDRVPADEKVSLEYESARLRGSVRLDLAGEHARELDELVRRYLDAGSKAAVATDGHGLKAGSAEARDYYAGLREWAASVGRSDEHWTSGKNGKPKQLYYPRQLRKDYKAHLMELARGKAA